jgi:hypothetical protein
MKLIHITTRFAAPAADLLIATTGMAGGDPAKPVRILIPSGQSNRTGRGAVGGLNKPAADQKATLTRFIMSPENHEKYRFLYNDREKDSRSWTARDDMFISKAMVGLLKN